jgi:hypothetical protein
MKSIIGFRYGATDPMKGTIYRYVLVQAYQEAQKHVSSTDTDICVCMFVQALCPRCHAKKTYMENLNKELELPHVHVCLRCNTIFSPYFKHVCKAT